LNLNGNLEIQKALKEFENQQGGANTPQSQQETVDVLKSQRTQISQDFDTPKMVKWVIKYSGGMIKNERRAEYMLLVLVIIMFGLSFYFFFGASIMNKINPPRSYVNSPGVILPGTRTVPMR